MLALIAPAGGSCPPSRRPRRGGSRSPRPSRSAAHRGRAGRRGTRRRRRRAPSSSRRLAGAGAGAGSAGRRRPPARGTAERSSRPSSPGSPPSTASTRASYPGDRPGRPRDEEGHPRVHRVRRRGRTDGTRRARPCRRPAARRGDRAGASACRARACRARRPPPQPRQPPLPAPPLRRAARPAAAGCTAGHGGTRASSAPARVEEPMTAMRRGVMEHMRRSLDTSAHVTSAIEVDMSKRRRGARAAEGASTSRLRRQPDLSRLHRPARRSRR